MVGEVKGRLHLKASVKHELNEKLALGHVCVTHCIWRIADGKANS